MFEAGGGAVIAARSVGGLGQHVGELRNTRVLGIVRVIEAGDGGGEVVCGGGGVIGSEVECGRRREGIGGEAAAGDVGELIGGVGGGCEIAGEGFAAGGVQEGLARRGSERGVVLSHSDEVQQKIHRTLWQAQRFRDDFGVLVPHNRGMCGNLLSGVRRGAKVRRTD